MVASWSWNVRIAFLNVFWSWWTSIFCIVGHCWPKPKVMFQYFFHNQAIYHQPVLKPLTALQCVLICDDCSLLLQYLCVVVCSCKPCLRWAGQAPFESGGMIFDRWLCDYYYNNLHCTHTFRTVFLEINQCNKKNVGLYFMVRTGNLYQLNMQYFSAAQF